MSYMITVHPGHIGNQTATSTAFVKRLLVNTPAIKPSVGVDAEGNNALIFATPTIPYAAHVATGVKNSATDFWGIIRRVNHVPKDYDEIPRGSLLVKVIDNDGVFKSKLVNPKHKREPADSHNYAVMGVHSVGTVAHVQQQKPARSRNIGQKNIRDMLKVVVDGRR